MYLSNRVASNIGIAVAAQINAGVLSFANKTGIDNV
jgi:hypothetical protein